MVVSSSGALRLLKQKSGPMLGVWEGTDYETFTERLAPGDSLLLYTDGVTEAVDKAGQFFSEERLEQFLTADPTRTADQLVSDLHAAVQGFSKGTPQADDITVLALRYLG